MRILVFLLSLQVIEHHRSNVPPLSLAEIETEALQNNREIAVMRQRVELAKAGVIPAAALDDPSFMYRAWSTPLLQPWNVNRTQHMFMYTQTLPGSGKRELRYQAAAETVAMAEAGLEAKKLEVTARARTAFYELLRNYDELRLHEEQ